MIKAILKWQYKRYCKKGYDKNLVPYSFETWLLYNVCGYPKDIPVAMPKDYIVGVDLGEGQGYTSRGIFIPNNTEDIIKEIKNVKLESK